MEYLTAHLKINGLISSATLLFHFLANKGKTASLCLHSTNILFQGIRLLFFLQPRLDILIKKSYVTARINKNNVDSNAAQFGDFVRYLKGTNLASQLPSIYGTYRMVVRLKQYSRYFERVIGKISPRACFQIGYYGIEGMALNYVCNRLNIPVVDIQHGWNNGTHRAYHAWNNIPGRGYELLPSIFWVWTEDDKKHIDAWANGTSFHRSIVGGHPFVEFYLNRDKESLQIYDEGINTVKKRFPEYYNILYTLNDYESMDRLAGIIDFMKDCKLPIFWWVRCHPCFLGMKEIVNDLIKSNLLSNVETDIATGYPLYSILKHMDLHITECSSTTFEAELFDVPSIITTAFGSEYFTEQIKSGWAVCAYTPDRILAAIKLLLDNRVNLMNKKTKRGTISKAIETIMQMGDE